MKLRVLMFRQDDPKKCTAAKIVRLGLASSVRSLVDNSIVLDPFAETTLLPKDKSVANYIVGVDCSWNLAEGILPKCSGGIKRRLPPLLAGNPVNYSKLGKLTTVEALSASLFIMGFTDRALELLDKFKWGHTFYDLNQNLFEEYSKLESVDNIPSIVRQYGLTI